MNPTDTPSFWLGSITPADAPRTLLAAVERDMRDAAYDAAITLAIDLTDAANRLVTYLAEHFVPGLAGTTARLNDERPPVTD